ncbi:MAG: DUF501 domain-containing protein [Coriobacteriia bacterium]|nr:DUF501 domain-containing protein [Coriobacteriia bacterium]
MNSGRDAADVERQIGRPPRGRWRVALRCSYGRPRVIEVAPVLEDGSPFPTTLWLTCPWLAGAVSDVESLGRAAEWAGMLSADPDLAAAAGAADDDYRRLRASLADGADPCAGVGTAGQADPLAVKCLHARVAAALGGIADPVGLGVLASLGQDGFAAECPERRCEAVRGASRA